MAVFDFFFKWNKRKDERNGHILLLGSKEPLEEFRRERRTGFSSRFPAFDENGNCIRFPVFRTEADKPGIFVTVVSGTDLRGSGLSVEINDIVACAL